jgi:hypothetical protein
MTYRTSIPTQATTGATADTVQPGIMVKGAPIADPAEAMHNPYAAEVTKLHTFLMTAFPGAMGRTNVVAAETPVDVAIRLLQGLSATGVFRRCSAEYCNLPDEHDGEHGTVNYTPR